jgi:hypothetical protein
LSQINFVTLKISLHRCTVNYSTLKSIATVRPTNNSSITRFLQPELNLQQSIIKPQLKKIIDEHVSYTDDLRDVFPNYYDKFFLPFKKGDNKDLVFFWYSTNNENEKEDLESEV